MRNEKNATMTSPRESQHREAETGTTTEKKKKKPAMNKYDVYKELLEIENEEAINVPKDLTGCLRALKHSLDNPVLIRPPNKDFNTLVNQSRSVKQVNTHTHTHKHTLLEQSRCVSMLSIFDSLLLLEFHML